MNVNRIDLLNRSFSRSLRGYTPEEVDSFLHDVADALARLGDDRVRLQNRVVQLEDRLTESAAREAALREALVVTQRAAEDLKFVAQKEAQAILEVAQNRADSLLNQGNQRLARVLDEIADARKLKAQFEIKVRSVIESHLRLLELSRSEDARLEAATEALSRGHGGSLPDG